MRRFLTLVCLLFLALPAGITISGCYRNPAGNYCNGKGYGPKVTDVYAITLQPSTTGISMAFGQTRQISAPTAVTCKNASASVTGYSFGTSNNKLVDISPSGNMCAGTWNRNPIVKKETMLTEAIATITKARAGAVTIVDGAGKLCGIFTDGDLRRKMSQDPNLLQSKIGSVMTSNPRTITPDRLASEALKILHEKKIDELPVVNEKGEPVGMLDVQDLLDVGVV